MKTLKIVLFVVSLLSLGFVGGFYTHRFVVHKKIQKVAELRFAMGFKNHLFEVIKADEEQKDKLAPYVNDYAQQIAKVSRDYRERRIALIDSLYKEIKPLLTKEQLEELEDFSRRFRQKERERRERRKKPPHRMEKPPQ